MTYYIIGIRRSGIHAIANWLFPMMGDFVYLNNYELGKLDEKELVIKGSVNVLIGIENKHVADIMKYCTNGKRIWVYRNFEEVKRSQLAWYSGELETEEVNKRIALAEELDCEYRDVIWDDNGEYLITYEAWRDLDWYRAETAKELGLKFDDSNKESVFGYGVSSYKK